MSKLVIIALSLVAGVAVAFPGDWSGEIGWNAHRSGIPEESAHLEGEHGVDGHLAGHGHVGEAHGAEVQGTLGGVESGQGHVEHISLFGPNGASGQVGVRGHPQEVHDHHYYHQH